MSAKNCNMSKQVKVIRTKPKGKNKKGRVIIRNLSFKATEEVLRNNFSQFGEISEIIIPKKSDGKMCGFGFVQFVKTASAIKAINALNAKKILGRPVAIDFAIPKDRFNEVKAQSSHPKQKETKNYVSTESKDSSSDDNDSDEEEELSAKRKKTKQSKSNRDNNLNCSNDEDSPDEKIKHSRLNSESDLDSSNDDCDSSVQNLKHSRSGSDSEDDSEDEDCQNTKRKKASSYTDSDDSDDEDHSNRKKKKTLVNMNSVNDKEEIQKKSTKLRPSDVGEGRTLFIRNLSFDTTVEELKETMSKYGDIKYCLLCKDPLTEYPKGTAFIQFLNKEDAEKCLENSNNKDDKIILGGRMLNVALALSHEDIKKQKEERIKKGKDNRNLKLEREGLITPGSDAAKGVSQPDLTKRLQLEKYKRKLLKNLNYFISPVRLCVHNIPLHFDDKKLWKIFLKAAGPGAMVTEARIMRNFKKIDEKGVGLSKGFGFVGFTKHEHALQALRKLNNNPDVFSLHKRPIVEFSVENRSILNAKRRQMERQNKKPFQPKKPGNHLNIDNMEEKKQKFLGNRKKKFSKQFKPKKIGKQQLNIANKLKTQKGKFQDDIKRKGKKTFKGDGKKRKKHKVSAL